MCPATNSTFAAYCRSQGVVNNNISVAITLLRHRGQNFREQLQKTEDKYLIVATSKDLPCIHSEETNKTICDKYTSLLNTDTNASSKKYSVADSLQHMKCMNSVLRDK